ncbi:MAG: excinuclease ABC subunit UvrC, partial [Candidatus Cloacimonetes bacterium]|nr:excinuclease ABC subunit UvrC [Candidatus Cloacimonadota bacterium]
ANIGKEDYKVIVHQVLNFLQGKDQLVLDELHKQMNELAEKMKFEEAALIRDRINNIEKLHQNQNIYFSDGKSRDVIGFYRVENLAAVTVLKILSGKLLNREVYKLDNVENSTEAELIEAFLKQYYVEKNNSDNEEVAENLPFRIICQIVPDNYEEINIWLKNKLVIPQKGDLSKLIALAKENAFNLVENEKLKYLRQKEKSIFPVKDLKERLNLSKLPRNVVCFDISNIQGTDTVASMVFFENGKPKKKNYRRFIVKDVNSPDDFASMYEVITRYLKRVKSGEELTPDLMVIDGGKGQLNIARKVFMELSIENIELISLAKRVEEVFIPGLSESIMLARSSSGLKMLVHLRDEAHRFAISFHRIRRNKRTLFSELDNINGLSEAKKFLLLKELGSVENIRKASIEDLTTIKGIGFKLAKKINENLNRSLYEDEMR